MSNCHSRLASNELSLKQIAMGRGGRANHHGGNAVFRRIVRYYQMKYISKGMKRADKIALKYKVMECLLAGGLLFMEKGEDDLWYPVASTKRILKKVAQALREKAPELRRAANKKDSIFTELVWSDTIADTADTATVVSDGSSVASAAEAEETCDANGAWWDGAMADTGNQGGSIKKHVVTFDEEDLTDPLLEFGNMDDHHLILPPLVEADRLDDLPQFHDIIEANSPFYEDVAALSID